MNNNKINGSIVANGNVIGSVNANRSKVDNDSAILEKARKQSFWISLIVGIVSSLIASIIFYWVTH